MKVDKQKISLLKIKSWSTLWVLLLCISGFILLRL